MPNLKRKTTMRTMSKWREVGYHSLYGINAL